MNLDRLLKPSSVAIVGVSADANKISGILLNFLRKSGFAGRIYPVNPRYEMIGELPCYASVEALPETVDLLVCVVPVAAAFDSIIAAAQMKVPYCLLMTGGFGEGRSGDVGNERRERLLEICRRTGMQIVGPNTVGLVNFVERMPLTFADWYGRDTGQRGGVAIVTHSGSVGGLAFSSFQINRIGVDYWIGLGNEATLEAADFIDHFSDDPCVHTIVCFMEGVKNGRNFMAACEKARLAGKTVIVLKAGKSPESVRATLSHTTKDPTSADVYAGIFRQLGVVEVSSLSELTYVAKLVTGPGRLNGNRIGILSASGGACSLMADQAVSAGLAMPELPLELQERLNRTIPEYGSSRNPVDLSADVISRREILDSTLLAISSEKDIDAWIVFGRPVIDRYHEDLAAFSKSSSGAVIVSSGVPLAPAVEKSLSDAGVAVMDDPELCLRALGALHRAGFASNMPARDWIGPAENAGDNGQAMRLLEENRLESAEALPVLRVTTEEDRDFGMILTLSPIFPSGIAGRRVVRALPAGARDMEDMAHDFAKSEGHLPAPAATIEWGLATVARAGTSNSGGTEIAVDLAVSGDRFVLLHPQSRKADAPSQPGAA